MSSGISSWYASLISFSRASRSFPPSDEKETPRLLLPTSLEQFFYPQFFLPLLNSAYSFSIHDQFKACMRCQLPLYSGDYFCQYHVSSGGNRCQIPVNNPYLHGGGGWGGVIDKCIRHQSVTHFTFKVCVVNFKATP